MIEDRSRVPDRVERRALLGVLSRAFRDNPMNVAIHGPSPRRRLRANRAGLAGLVLESDDGLVSRVVSLEGQVVGGWIAAPPFLRTLPPPALRFQFGCLLLQGVRAMDRWREVGATLQRRRPLVPHWYLAVLGVDPAFQGRGLGRRLVDAFVEIARADRVPAYLECDRDESVAFYRRQGFVVRGTVCVHGVPCRCLGLGFADESAVVCDSVRDGPRRGSAPGPSRG